MSGGTGATIPLDPKRKCKCEEHRLDAKWHGTGGYVNHRCRCDICYAAHSERCKAWWAGNGERTRQYPKARRSRQAAAFAEVDAKDVRHMARWTPDEDAVALRADLSTAAAAKQLGRTVDAVHARRMRLTAPGPLVTDKRRRWTAAEDAVVQRADLSVGDVAAALGRTMVAVSTRRARLAK